jgi:hypothetical protein
MDSMTHIYFAERLLRSADFDSAAVDCSLFPQIDRTPAYYHRLYAHSVPKTRAVVDAARTAYWSDPAAEDESSYFAVRLREDATRIRRYVAASPFHIANNQVPPAEAQCLAFVSHIYNDQFNNPIQAFVPFSVYPSGAWSLWEQLDAAEFRWFLYEKAAITALRDEVFAASEWDARVPAAALTTAMVTRLAAASAVEIAARAIEQTLRTLGLEDVPGTVEHKEADRLLQDHDARLADAIKRFSRARDLSPARQWAGQGI